MRLPAFIIALVLFACQSIRESKDPATPGHPLPDEKEISISYTAYEVCNTWYYPARDSFRPILAKVLSHDEMGREKETVYWNYESYVPATSVTLYDSTGRVSAVYHRVDEKGRENETSKTLYYYNNRNQLTRSVSFDFKRRIRKEVDKGFGRPGGCIINEEDYEDYKSWDWTNEIIYSYDDSGRLTEERSSDLNGEPERRLCKYDEEGKLAEERLMEGSRVVWIKSYRYRLGGYEFTRTWFEEDGSRQKEADGSTSPMDTFRFKTNAANLITEERIIEEGGREVTMYKKYYDSQNRLIKNEIYIEGGKLLGYYEYRYKDAGKPVLKNFIVKRS